MIDVSSCNYINNMELGVNANSLLNIIQTMSAVLHVNPITVNPCGALSCIQGRPESEWSGFGFDLHCI